MGASITSPEISVTVVFGLRTSVQPDRAAKPQTTTHDRLYADLFITAHSADEMHLGLSLQPVFPVAV